MAYAILDCYTDEPSGLGVPPYIGTYPRYIAGALRQAKQDYYYLTIDDLRGLTKKKGDPRKTDIRTKNKSLNHDNTQKILETANAVFVVSGVHTPGKYLSALPGTAKEAATLLKSFNIFKVLTGPAASGGEGLFGGRYAVTGFEGFDAVIPDIEFKISELINMGFSEDISADTSYSALNKLAVLGAEVVKQHPSFPNLIVELETAKGCSRKTPCSFCTEPLKNVFHKREIKEVIDEAKALSAFGVNHFRIGKQADFFDRSNSEIESLLKGVRSNVNVKTLHIDNADPVFVTDEKVKTVVKYCTPGNIAALGVESFDSEVIKQNNLHSTPETTMKAIRIINKYGAKRGDNGMPLFVPGINLLYGLKGETKETHVQNMNYMNQILDENLLLRRINIRQVVIFPGTQLEKECGAKFIRKNKKYYWKWRNDVRQNIDNQMLQNVVPKGTILKDVFMEVHDGKHTFGRQMGTYPLIVGVNKKLDLNKFYNIKIIGWMLRSVVGEVC